MTAHGGDSTEIGEVHEVLAKQETTPVPKLSPMNWADGRPKTVFILEDDIVQRRLLEQHLSSLGLNIVAAGTIAEATEKLAECQPQVAIFDVHLPDGSGLEFCESIDSDPRHSGMPIIVLSSVNDQDMVRRTRASGGYYFIGKPYDPNVLLILIEKTLGDSID